MGPTVEKCFAPELCDAGEALPVVVHVTALKASLNSVRQSICVPPEIAYQSQCTVTTGGGPTGGVVGVGVGVPGTGVATAVGDGVVNFTTTDLVPVRHTVMLHAVISTETVASWLNVVENAVDPGATGAGRPFTLQRVVVYVPVTVPVQVTPAAAGAGV
ncbi:MAG: hypothetical protein IPO51_15945 [Dehalococcoidia bacterium]|nr:hypothetical protein [Dehalococcoidia bacterium]